MSERIRLTNQVCQNSLLTHRMAKECHLCEMSLLQRGLKEAGCIAHDVDDLSSLELKCIAVGLPVHLASLNIAKRKMKMRSSSSTGTHRTAITRTCITITSAPV